MHIYIYIYIYTACILHYSLILRIQKRLGRSFLATILLTIKMIKMLLIINKSHNKIKNISKIMTVNNFKNKSKLKINSNMTKSVKSVNKIKIINQRKVKNRRVFLIKKNCLEALL